MANIICDGVTAIGVIAIGELLVTSQLRFRRVGSLISRLLLKYSEISLYLWLLSFAFIDIYLTFYFIFSFIHMP